MNKYKVQKIIVCEVSVWGYVEANNMHDAMVIGGQIGTDDPDYDHQIIGDMKTLEVTVQEETP